MRRRDLIAVVAGAVTLRPIPARTQEPTLRVVGFLQTFRPPAGMWPPADFRNALRELGYTEGQKIAFDARWTDHYEELPNLASELVRRPAAVIVAWGYPSALVAKAATSSIPIIFWTGADPVAQGLVASLAHPGGNLTGIAEFNAALGAKRLELLKELIPNVAVVGLLINPTNPYAGAQSKDAEDAARLLGVQVQVGRASTEGEIEIAFANLAARRSDAVMVAADPFIYNHREQVVALASRHRLPTMYTVSAYVSLGGLISYTSAADNRETALHAARYTGRILNGEKPADLPVIMSSRFQMAVNMKTAKELGLAVPHSLLARADEVIE